MYTPSINPPAWTEIQGFVHDVVEAVKGLTPYGDRDLLLAVSRLALWSSRTAGLDLERDTLFRREIINRFIAVGCPGQTSAARSNLRSQLLRVAESVLGPRLAPVRLTPLSASDPSWPYSAKEVASLFSWAGGQSTLERRDNAALLLAAGLGAGLSAREVGELRGRDVLQDTLGVTIRVSTGRGRYVPVLSEFAQTLINRRSQLSDDSYLFRPGHEAFYPNLISNFVARGGASSTKPQTQRLRATWIVWHLDAGTPVVALMTAAGVDSLEAFTRYTQFVDELPKAVAVALLRGSSASFTPSLAVTRANDGDSLLT